MSVADREVEPEDDSVCEQCQEEPVYGRRSHRLCCGCWHAQQDDKADERYEGLRR